MAEPGRGDGDDGDDLDDDLEDDDADDGAGDVGGAARAQVPVSGPTRLDVAVAGAVPGMSRAQSARLVQEGRVTVDGRVVVKPGAKVSVDSIVVFEVPPATPTEIVAQDLPLPIVYQDAALAVVDKPAGMVVHPAAGHPDGTLVNALLFHLDGLSGVGGQQRPGLVHRLDRGTSGLLVVAKTDVAHRALSEQFAAHTAGRIYLAWVHDPPDTDQGTVTSHLARHPRDRLRFASTGDPMRGRRAVTHWEVVARPDIARGLVGLVGCKLETGRTHQVRVHLSELGCPIVGDALYHRSGASALPRVVGAIDASGDRPLLHAWRLAFAHPDDGRRLSFVADPPDDFSDVAARLGVALPPGPSGAIRRG